MQLTGNFHTVVPGKLYRSAQPSAGNLEVYAKQYGLKTLINLRGAAPGARWYEDEKRVAKAMGLTMIDFQMSASHEFEVSRAKELVALLKSAQTPILIHCKAGADRSGLVSVIYASQVAGMDEEDAERQLWPIYGHLGIPVLSSTYAMDKSWEALEPVFGIKS
ncbi:tyrosine-protein phosphatase [Mesorhizobium sp. 1M-11]|uniref:tyrosine-protein phosphatase n=1 Tax=Mesorhizobium sp. 1M-11 TaxID=1529006 RepID=UPI001FCDEEDD|nr:tyrosine-protein phosphatase [Mesorhizobium sp. 1M-11]